MAWRIWICVLTLLQRRTSLSNIPCPHLFLRSHDHLVRSRRHHLLGILHHLYRCGCKSTNVLIENWPVTKKKHWQCCLTRLVCPCRLQEWVCGSVWWWNNRHGYACHRSRCRTWHPWPLWRLPRTRSKQRQNLVIGPSENKRNQLHNAVIWSDRLAATLAHKTSDKCLG